MQTKRVETCPGMTSSHYINLVPIGLGLVLGLFSEWAVAWRDSARWPKSLWTLGTTLLLPGWLSCNHRPIPSSLCRWSGSRFLVQFLIQTDTLTIVNCSSVNSGKQKIENNSLLRPVELTSSIRWRQSKDKGLKYLLRWRGRKPPEKIANFKFLKHFRKCLILFSFWKAAELPRREPPDKKDSWGLEIFPWRPYSRLISISIHVN